MNHSWNVYKVFASGKRAKMPLHVFEYDGDGDVYEHFSNEVKNILVETKGEKIKKTSFTLIRTDESQERIDPNAKTEEYERLRNKVIAKHLKYIKGDYTNISVGVTFRPETDWKWQWCIMEPATHQYIGPVSEKFDSYEGAQEWMTSEIKLLNGSI
tara:strand:- start:677 stop:1144 length:468 start_codon:yes stop_codon:yes gene_type:complete